MLQQDPACLPARLPVARHALCCLRATPDTSSNDDEPLRRRGSGPLKSRHRKRQRQRQALSDEAAGANRSVHTHSLVALQKPHETATSSPLSAFPCIPATTTTTPVGDGPARLRAGRFCGRESVMITPALLLHSPTANL